MTEEQEKLIGLEFRHFKGNLYRLEGFAKDITLASALLSFEGTDSFKFSYGSPLVLAATVCYVRAQNTLGAAKTSAYYAAASFVGAFLSFLLLKESLSWIYLAALAVMIAGAVLVVIDTLVRHHTHPHSHTYTHFHGGYVHTHTVTHTHGHDHFMTDATHTHRHSVSELEHAVVHKPAAK